MLPVDVELVPLVKSSEENSGAEVSDQARTFPRRTVSIEIAAPTTRASSDGEIASTPAPNTSDARRIPRCRLHESLQFVSLSLRVATAILTFLAFAVIWSASFTPYDDDRPSFPYPDTIKFSNFFYLSYLLAVNLLTCAYVILTIFLSCVLSSGSFSHHVVIVSRISVFVLDQVLSFFLISAASSAAAGITIDKPSLHSYHVTTDFFWEAHTATFSTFVSFFVMALLALISAHRAAPTISQFLWR